MIVNVEQLRRVLYAVPGAACQQVRGMDCTTEEKSTITGGPIGDLGCPRSGRTMELHSVAAVLLTAGYESFATAFCVSHTLSSTTASPRLRIQTGGEGVGGRAAVGAYDAFVPQKLIHIALGQIGLPLVNTPTTQILPTLGFQLPKKKKKRKKKGGQRDGLAGFGQPHRRGRHDLAA